MSVTEVAAAVEELSERDKALLGEGHRLLPLNSNSGGVAKTLMVKSGQGICYGFSVYNSSATPQYVLLMTPGTFTTAGATPIMCYPIAGNTTLAVDYGQHGRAFRQGLALANSTTDTTLTAGSANCIFDAQYI